MTQSVLPEAARLDVSRQSDVEAVIAIEQQAYSHPWTRGNFEDALRSGYRIMLLRQGSDLLGYYVAMKGVGEVHLLNVAVAPRFVGQGWARFMLQDLYDWAHVLNAETLWLEVRVGNARALTLYEAQGFKRVGLRKGYYPDGHGRREDAVVMNRVL